MSIETSGGDPRLSARYVECLLLEARLGEHGVPPLTWDTRDPGEMRIGSLALRWDGADVDLYDTRSGPGDTREMEYLGTYSAVTEVSALATAIMTHV